MRLIDRQEAIKALEKAGEVNYIATGDFHGIINALNVIKGLPNANPTPTQHSPKWIPTRDRKPTKAGQYLVTKQQKTGELQRATAHYNPSFDEWSGNGNFGKVLAWMELPPVYKEDADD